MIKLYQVYYTDIRDLNTVQIGQQKSLHSVQKISGLKLKGRGNCLQLINVVGGRKKGMWL
jgi:hypothetical protein